MLFKNVACIEKKLAKSPGLSLGVLCVDVVQIYAVNEDGVLRVSMGNVFFYVSGRTIIKKRVLMKMNDNEENFLFPIRVLF